MLESADSVTVNASKINQKKQDLRKSSYPRFELINGNHDFKAATGSWGFVSYQAKRKHGGKVFYFNFSLAKEMGLISNDHPEVINPNLEDSILSTFAIQIINEYDIAHKTPIPKKDILPNTYMATRYLQLQHPSKSGKTSGDGRSIWNGQISFKGVKWDITSCGTGATALSPACAIENKFFKTGDPYASYGCGTAHISEGISTAIMSRNFYQKGIETERTLAIIEFSNGQSINVRAGKNLLRPSHFFHHLKQCKYERLKKTADYFIDRECFNQNMTLKSSKKKYESMVYAIANNFAKAAARFESDYIFVWIDWDGDNILCNGGIIDYGSVRQFGLYHHEYRFDDDQRWSTKIKEQKNKARETIKTFIQAKDYLETSLKKPRHRFNNHKILKYFDNQFEQKSHRLLLKKMGLNKKEVDFLVTKNRSTVRKFKKIYQFFEKKESSKKHYKVGDGVTKDAIYCMRDLLREIPKSMHQNQTLPDASQCLEWMSSTYASQQDKTLTNLKKKKLNYFLFQYSNLINLVCKNFNLSTKKLSVSMMLRTSVESPERIITGESIIRITDYITHKRKSIAQEEILKLIKTLSIPEKIEPIPSPLKKTTKKIILKSIQFIDEFKESI